MVKCVIFDMDGLMFDSERVVGECLKKAALSFGYIVTDEIRFQLLGRSRQDNQKTLMTYFGEDYPYHQIRALTQTYREEYYQKHGIPIKKGLIALLNFLKEKQIYTAVASSTAYEDVMRYLENTQIISYIDYVIGGNQVKQSKPHPEIFLKACYHFQLKPEECLVLEDSQNGILAAYHGHIPVICVPDLVKHPDHITQLTLKTVESLYDVIDYLKQEQFL